MSNPRIEFDPQFFDSYSVQSLEEKKAKLGFFQKEKNVYVLTATNCQKDIRVETSITKIVNLFQESGITFQLPQHSQGICKAIQYLDSLGKVVGKHNSHILEARKKGILKFLSSIPLINRIVLWFFKELKLPETFISQAIQQQEKVIQQQLEEADSIQALAKCKNDWLENIKNARVAQSRLRGTGYDIWAKEEQLIQQAYEKRVINLVPALQLAKTIIHTNSQDTIRTYREILKLTDNVEIDRAVSTCNETLRNLNLDDAIQKLIPESLQASIEQAANLARNAYGQWQAQRILALYQNTDSPPTQAVLGVENSTEFASKFEKLLQRLQNIQPPNPAAVEKLQQAYKDYLEKQAKALISNFSQPNFVLDNQSEDTYRSLERELNKIQPLASETLKSLQDVYANHIDRQVKSLVSQLSSSKSVFSQLTTSKETKIAYQKNYLLIEHWKKSQEKRLPVEKLNSMASSYRAQFKHAYEEDLKRRLPIYAEAWRLLSQENTGPKDVPKITYPNSSSTTHMSEAWYLQKMELFEKEISNLDQEDLVPGIYEDIKKIHEQIQTDYGLFKKEQLQSAAQMKPSKPIISKPFFKVISGWMGNSGKKPDEYPLKQYRKIIINMLKIEDKKPTEEQIKAKYEIESASLKKSEATKEAFDLLEIAYSRYQKIQQIQLLLKKVSNPYFEKNSLEFNDLFPEIEDKKENILILEKKQADFLATLDEEIAIQAANEKVLRALKNTKSSIEDFWFTYLEKQYPNYRKAIEIVKKIAETLEENKKIALKNKEIEKENKEISKKNEELQKQKNFRKNYSSIPYNPFISYISYYKVFGIQQTWNVTKVKKEIEGLKAAFTINEEELKKQPTVIQQSFIDAHKWVCNAYIEWEADHILNKKETAQSLKELGSLPNAQSSILGVSDPKERKKRYGQLGLLLHPDKIGNNVDLTKELKEKFSDALITLTDFCGNNA